MRKFALLLMLCCFALPVFAQEDEQTPYEIALQRIQDAEASGATELDLSGLGLTELPPEIGSLTGLIYLELESNQLISLPPEIGKLSNLLTLSLSNNHLNSLPPELGKLNQLCLLLLMNNQLQHLPFELAQLESLREPECYLNLDGNSLISPPPEVIAQGTPAILDYLENEAWWHLQRLIIAGATGFGIVAAFILGMRWRHRGKKKRA